mgnify:CR=1 FL=1
MSWPERPPASADQGVLPLEGTLERAFRSWRATEEGQAVIGYVVRRALEEAQRGAWRIEVNALFAEARARLRLKCNNSFRAAVSRELRAKYPHLRSLIHVRERKAA